MQQRFNVISIWYNVNVSDKECHLVDLQTSLSKREKLNIKLKERTEGKNYLRQKPVHGPIR